MLMVGCTPRRGVWWMGDNSQRRATKVSANQLRRPNLDNSSAVLRAASDAFRVAAEWTAIPLLNGLRALGSSPSTSKEQ